jgi:exosortase
MKTRSASFLAFNVIALVIFYAPLLELLKLSFHEGLYSHVLLIPLLCGYLIYLKRKEIFSNIEYSFEVAIIPVIGISLYLIGGNYGARFTQNDHLSLMAFSAVIFWTGGFILFYGSRALRNAAFPILILFFMIPVPDMVMEKIIVFLQWCSAAVAYGLFKLTGVPFARDGNMFHLPGLSIEVAAQCSGIRSSLVLFIVSLLLGNLFLKSWWKKIILTLIVLPITVFKNGLRIVVLSMLGAYVDERVLSSALHRQGGIPFFLFALMLLTAVLWFLRRSENKLSE